MREGLEKLTRCCVKCFTEEKNPNLEYSSIEKLFDREQSSKVLKASLLLFLLLAPWKHEQKMLHKIWNKNVTFTS